MSEVRFPFARNGATHSTLGGTTMLRGLLIGGLLLAFTSANNADDKSATPKLGVQPATIAASKIS